MKKICIYLIEFYKKHDADYRKRQTVQSVYDNKKPLVYMVTGYDTDVITNYAKPIGVAKGESKDIFGHSHSYESYTAVRDYFSNVKSFLNKSCKRLKSSRGKNLILTLYFEPQYTKKQTLKSFKFKNARFSEVK